MTVTLFKVVVIGCAGCGIVATPFLGISFKSPYSEGQGSWKRAVHLIAKSESGNVKLFVEKDKEKFELKVAHNNKEKKGKFILCSPSLNEKEYYLLTIDSSGWWRQNLNEITTVQDCQEKSKHNMGERLSIEVKTETKDLLKEIDLNSCKIEDLRKESWVQGNPLLELTCSPFRASRDFTQKEIKILSRSYEELTLSS
ncbi:hypothetical protein DNK47_02150 [Mycoplasma wenyonii]|uniref:Uncharacterized protein n=1 Tax=Mycoplasma wenyonii TaxID=65123 RepID=A0A328PRQ7_9MOLU|nr:hypothetical protein [Mycoplasma wenyonii]RAO94997.1 hypothetical protein DNK47_02150 [Mycoplasma wenyonii]